MKIIKVAFYCKWLVSGTSNLYIKNYLDKKERISNNKRK